MPIRLLKKRIEKSRVKLSRQQQLCAPNPPNLPNSPNSSNPPQPPQPLNHLDPPVVHRNIPLIDVVTFGSFNTPEPKKRVTQ